MESNGAAGINVGTWLDQLDRRAFEDLYTDLWHTVLEQAQEKGIITAEEAETVREADRVCEAYIQVAVFTLDEYRQNSLLSGGPTDRGALDAQIVDALDRDPTQVEVAARERGDGAPLRGHGAPTSPEAGTGDASSDRSGPKETA